MNYEAHLTTVFETPELAETFMKAIIRSLNEITFNGKRKINGVSNYGTVTVKFNECRLEGLGGPITMPKESYIYGYRKADTVTLD